MEEGSRDERQSNNNDDDDDEEEEEVEEEKKEEKEESGSYLPTYLIIIREFKESDDPTRSWGL